MVIVSLLVDPSALRLDGPPGQPELCRDLRARVAERDQSDDLRLTRTQPVAADRFPQRLQTRRDPGAHELFSARSAGNRGHQLGICSVLEHESDRPCVDRTLR